MRRRLANLVFFASVLALLATSPRRWTMVATVTGPRTPAPPKGLAIEIDSSERPTVTLHTASVSRHDELPCLGSWSMGSKLSCLLPPGATLDTVEIRGMCTGGGCSGGPCAPPPGAFARVTSSETDVWDDVAKTTMTVPLPIHPAGFIASRFDVKTSGSDIAKVTFTASAHVGGARIMSEDQIGQDLWFMVYDSAVPKGDVDVTVEATGWGDCKGAPCAAPKTFRIDSVTIAK